jgi:hypothetical protein
VGLKVSRSWPIVDSVPEDVYGAGRGGAEQGLELGKGVLDRVQVRAVGRQVEQAGAGGRDRRANALDLVGGEVVHHDEIAGAQGRRQGLLDAPVMGPSNTQGAVRPSWRSAATKVVVLQ